MTGTRPSDASNLAVAEARIKELDAEVDSLEAQVEEMDGNFDEYERDCARVLRQIAAELNYEWEPDGATADELGQYVLALIADSTPRDASMKSAGAAEWIEATVQDAMNDGRDVVDIDAMTKEAARRRCSPTRETKTRS
jgi:multidrug resistance efflux pump